MESPARGRKQLAVYRELEHVANGFVQGFSEKTKRIVDLQNSGPGRQAAIPRLQSDGQFAILDHLPAEKPDDGQLESNWIITEKFTTLMVCSDPIVDFPVSHVPYSTSRISV